jgi:hypothetical protein
MAHDWITSIRTLIRFVVTVVIVERLNTGSSGIMYPIHFSQPEHESVFLTSGERKLEFNRFHFYLKS